MKSWVAFIGLLILGGILLAGIPLTREREAILIGSKTIDVWPTMYNRGLSTKDIESMHYRTARIIPPMVASGNLEIYLATGGLTEARKKGNGEFEIDVRWKASQRWVFFRRKRNYIYPNYFYAQLRFDDEEPVSVAIPLDMSRDRFEFAVVGVELKQDGDHHGKQSDP